MHMQPESASGKASGGLLEVEPTALTKFADTFQPKCVEDLKDEFQSSSLGTTEKNAMITSACEGVKQYLLDHAETFGPALSPDAGMSELMPVMQEKGAVASACQDLLKTKALQNPLEACDAA